MFELNGVPIGVSICEDIWEPGPPAMTEALAGAQVLVNLSASPYRRGYGARRERMLDPARRGLPGGRGVREHRRRPGRARVRRAQRGREPRGRPCSRAGPQFEESLAVCSIDPREVVAARLRDTRHRANVRHQRRAEGRAALGHGEPRPDHGGPPGAGPAPSAWAASWPSRWAPRRRGVRRAAHRAARLRREERLREGGAGALRRDRLGAGRAHRRGRRRARSA